ncbi:MAG: serine hydrolase [Thermoleophilaceae bacterium]
MRSCVLAPWLVAMLAGVVAAAPAGAVPRSSNPLASDSERAWHPALRAARAYASRRTGFTSFALRTPRRLYGYRDTETTRSASVVKAMLMVAYLNHRNVRGRRLRGAQRGLIGPMIRRSDNGAATRVRNFVGNGALVRLARRVGMRDFAPSLSWGATRVRARDQAKLFLRIDRFVVGRHRRFAMRLLGSIVAHQRWGIAQVRPRGWALYFKSGWVPGTENQVGLLRRGKRRVAVAVFTAGQSAAYGRATEREVARRLLRGLKRDSVPR